MALCSKNTETITTSNYMDNYKTSTRNSCLPNNGTGFATSSISASGIVNKAELDTHINTLLTQMSAVAPTPSNSVKPDEFANKAATLRANINTEYCFYYVRYSYILTDLLTTAATISSVSIPATYTTKKENTEKLNSKLNQILQVLQALVNSRLLSLKDYYGQNTGVNALNTQIDTTREQLITHAKLLKKNDLEKDAKAAMIEYSIEKNSSSRNLLAIYGFMNIVAAGLIFYLYRTAKN
jgi:hypothetical protein